MQTSHKISVLFNIGSYYRDIYCDIIIKIISRDEEGYTIQHSKESDKGKRGYGDKIHISRMDVGDDLVELRGWGTPLWKAIND